MNLAYPFSLISGNGLGVSYSSLTQIGPAIPSRDFGVLKMQSFINVSTGNLIIFDHKLIVQEQNFPLEFYYVYNSHAETMADIWRFAHKRFKLLPKPDQTSSAILIEKDGHETDYQFDSKTNRWLAPYWSDSRPYLHYDKPENQWVWFDPKTQITEIYNDQGYLQERLDSRNERTRYRYDDLQTPWKLTKILAPESNYEFHQHWVNNERIESIYEVNAGSPTLLRTSVFDRNARLIRTILPAERTEYAKRPQINFVYRAPSKDPAELSDEDVYNLAYLDYIKQTDADTSNLSLMYDVPPNLAPRRISSVYLAHPPLHTSGYLVRFYYHQSYAIVESYAKVATKLYFNIHGSITQIDRERGYPNTTYSPIDSCFYTYNVQGQLASITSAGQGKHSFQYEAQDGLLIKQQKANGQITEYVYDEVSKRHNLIAKIHFATGKAQVTRKVYDHEFSLYRGLYLRFEISPEGRVTEYRYEDFGHLKYTIIYLEGYFPVDTYAKNAVPNLAEMTRWVAQQDLQKISLTECRYYDGCQRRQTYYYGTINEKGEGVHDEHMSQVTTHYTLFGALCFKREYRKKADNPLYTFLEYDSARRLLSHKNAANEVTNYRYDNSHTEITRPNNRKEMTEWDACERLSKEKQTIPFNDQLITRETTYSRNIVGSCTEKCTTADGQLSYRFYDKQNRLGFSVHPNGRLTEYRYDAQNRNKITIAYAKAIDIKKLESLGWHGAEPDVMDLLKLMKEMAIADPKQDRFSYEFYDYSNRLSEQVDAENFFCQTLYNDHDAVIAEIRYASPLKPEQLAALLQGKSLDCQADPKCDRIQRKFYDADQLLIGTQDAAGYVIEYKHNGAAWITEIIRYAQPQIISINTQRFDKIRPVASSKDAHEYFFYNPRGWVVLSVDAEAYVTTKDYLLNGLVSCEKRYANPVDATWYKDTQRIPSLPVASVDDQTIDYEYDELNREISSHRSDGKVIFTRYDTMGEIIAKGEQDATTMEITGDTYRANEFRFDAWGQTLSEASKVNSESLARIDADSTLKPEEKQKQKEKIWQETTRRHAYDASGLKLSTAIRSSQDASDQLTYFYYNAERQRVLTIQIIADKQVQIREYARDVFNNIVQIRDYSQAQLTLADRLNQPLTGGFMSDTLRKALDAIQNTQDVVTQKIYNKRDEVVKLIDGEAYETQHLPNAFSEVSQSKLPVQTKQPSLVIQHQYDGRGLEISTQRQADTLNTKVKRDYSNPYGKLTHIRDELKGDYQRDYDRKGRLIGMQNPLQQQRSDIAYDAWDQPTKMTNALGQTTQHLYHLNKRREIIIDPLGNQRIRIRNIFSETIKEIDAKQQTQTWQHTADGQISHFCDALGRGYEIIYNLLGDITEKQILNGIKTQYRYDARKHLIAKIEDTEGLKRQTRYEYNLLGQRIKTIDAQGTIQLNQYDRRGLVVEQCFDTKKTGLNLTTTRQYNGQKQLLSETQGDIKDKDQYIRHLDYDGLNRHCTTIIDPVTETRKEALNIQTQQHKNGQDSVLAEIDANGHVTRFIMDSAGRRCFKINALRGVTEWNYNPADQIILERHYQRVISENEVAQINDETTPEQLRALLQTSVEDTLIYPFYDANANTRFSVSGNDQQGYVKEKRYDAKQQEIQTIQYATAISIKSIEKLSIAQLAKQVAKIADTSRDRIHYFLRDEVGQLRFSIDPEHYVSEQRFDEQGRVIGQISYANPVEDPTQLIKLPIAEVLSHLNKEDSQDRYQFFFFDSLGQPLYTVKSEGQVVSYQHDAKGNLIEEVHFNQRLKVPQTYALLLQQLQALAPDVTQDRITQKVYDAANRLVQHTDALGYVETYQYDALGNRTTYTDRQQSMWKTIFDRAKRPAIEITPPVTITEISQDATGLLVSNHKTIAIEKHKTYDKVGNVTRIITAANTTEPRIFEAEYDGLNQWQKTSLPNIAVDDSKALKPDDWRYRPETKQTLTTIRITNAKGLKVAEQDAAGHWQFWVYDQQKRLVYHVNPLGVTIKKERDAFGKTHRKIINATPCTLDLSVYTKTGIPPSVLDAYYRTRHSDADRIIDYQRDRCGRVISERQGPVYCYTANLKSVSHTGTLSQEIAEIKKSYNAWGELVAQSEKMDAIRSKENFYWFDRNGQPLAEVDTVGLDNQAAQYRCKRFENDSFGQRLKRVAYAKILDIPINVHLSFAELKTALDKMATPEDRSEQFYYDKANRLVKKVRLQAIRQTLVLTHGLPAFSDAPPQDLSIGYQYNANGQQIAKTLEDSSTEWRYYDQRGCRVAQTEVARDNAGHSNILIPLSYFSHNAHGQIVLTRHFKQGAQPITPGEIPEPMASDPEDQQELRLYDARGNLQWKQTNQQIPQGFSYTAHGKPARQWWTLSHWQQTEANQYETKVHLDEKFFQYDAHNRPIQVELRRDAQTVDTTVTQYDAFDQVIREGETAESFSIYRRFDTLGRLWCSNTEKGIPVVNVHDLTGQCSLRMQSPSKDLGVISYQEIPSLLNWDINDLERTENQRDLAGRIITRSLPANYQEDTTQPQIIPLSILASNLYPKLGQVQSLSWPIPQEKNVQAEFSLWPKEVPEKKQTLPILIQEGRCGVDVSTLATDVYDYQVDYTFSDPEKTNEKILMYKSSGSVQFDTRNSTNSAHLVAITETKQTSLVRLTGNTRDISAVELWNEFGKRETLELQIDPVSHNYYVDLSHHSSGVYQLKPLTHDKKPHGLSLPFTIYTHKTAHKPLSRELTSALKFRYLENHVEVNWQVPTFLQSQVVKLQCHYLDRQSKPQLQTLEIVPDQKRTTYSDKKGTKIQSNVDFSVPIQTIEKLSLAVKWPQLSKSSVSTRLQHHWLMLTAENSDSSDEEEWEMIPHHEATRLETEPEDWIPLYSNETPSAPAFDPELITDLNFADKNLLVVSPLPDVTPDKQTPILEYLDVSLDRMRCWTQFAMINVITSGLVVDVTGFSAGVYPFRCQSSIGNLVLSLGGEVFPTQSMDEPDRQHLVQPARRYRYDVWNNKLTEIDTLGHVTYFRYNDADQLIQKQEPLVDVVDEQGNTKALSPITDFAYNTRGLQIAKRDANGNTRGYIFDAAGHRITEVLSDGTLRKTQIYDAFNHVIESHNACSQITQYFYDQQNNLLAFQKPSGSRRSYTYNELKQRNSDADPANNTRRYNFDVLGNLIERYEPLGQCTRMIYGRNHQLIKLENPDNSFLTWQRDAFGKALQHTDLSGAVYRYTYDYKGQLVDVRSEDGKHGDYFELQPIMYNGNLFGYAQVIKPLSGQHLHYQYVSGQVTELNDLATGKKTSYRYDSEGRRIAASVISDKGEIFRETSSQIDALGREILTRDNQAIFTTAYDVVSNRRFIKGVVDVGGSHLTQEVWWKYDTEDRVIISEGVLQNGEITILPDRGMELVYQNDRRVTEINISSVHNEKMIADLLYDIDGRLVGSKVNGNYTNKSTERQYDSAGRQTLYRTTSPFDWLTNRVTENERIYNENGWINTNIQRQGRTGFNQSITRTDYQQLTAMGLPQQQTINYNDEAHNVDHLNCNYVGWDQWRIASIQGYRTNKHGTSDYSSVKNYLGPNGEPNAISGAEDPDGRDKYFIATPDGLILRRMHLVELNRYYRDVFVCSLETYYFYRVNGQYLASFKNKGYDFFDLALNWVSPQGDAGKEIGLSLTQDFSSLPQTYTCAAGDSYESIASNLYGDASLASYIDAANGGGTLIAGQTIVIPQLVSVHNKAGMARPYYQFLQIIQGSLTPHLDTPQPPQDDEGFFALLICAIAVVVVCVYPPAIAVITEIAGSLGVSVPIMTGVAAGLADAAAQELCVGMGIKDHFSLAESITAGITAGFASGFGGPVIGEKTIMTMVRMGMVNVSEQLTEMAIGIRQQFDIAGVVLAMGSAGLSSQIKIADPLERRLVADVEVAAMSSIVRGRFDVENLATQLITDAAAVGMQQQTKPISDDYHQSQKASGGVGQITQTTIDQQWDAHLINDAEFTADTSLPSVTFDVNNSYVAEQLGQRVGEEVSHFYHPTPPPRNPNGFWRGVDDVLKMREGTIDALSSVFTGNYETPQDPWKKAGYLLGEVIGNRFIGGRVIVGNVTQKLERLGFFGHNGTESLETGGRQIAKVRDALKADEHAALFYEKIRSNPSNIDVQLIAKNAGMQDFKIQRIKQHLFFNAHELSSGVGRFSPDIEIADAWNRLQQGNFVKQDLELLQHEYFESRFEGIFKTDYITAHNAAVDSLRKWDPLEFETTQDLMWRP